VKLDKPSNRIVLIVPLEKFSQYCAQKKYLINNSHFEFYQPIVISEFKTTTKVNDEKVTSLNRKEKLFAVKIVKLKNLRQLISITK
jgi:hypothetical protein